MSEENENEKKRIALQKYDEEAFSKARWQNTQQRHFDKFCEFIGWTEDEMFEMAESLGEIPIPFRPHYRDELLAIAKDLAYEVGVELDNKYQAAVLVLIFLGLDDDDDDEGEVEPEPEGEGELQPA